MIVSILHYILSLQELQDIEDADPEDLTSIGDVTIVETSDDSDTDHDLPVPLNAKGHATIAQKQPREQVRYTTVWMVIALFEG